MASGQGQRIDSSDFTSIKAKVDMVFGTGAGTSGYGQSISSNSATIGTPISKDIWQSLRNDMVKIRQHQLGVPVGISNEVNGANLIVPDVAVEISEQFRNQYNSFANTITLDRFKVADNQTTTSIIVNGQRNTPWKGKITHLIDCSGDDTGGSIENLRYFFNAGGKLKLSQSRSGGASTTQNSQWTELLTNVGDVIIDHDNTTNTGNIGIGYALGWDNLTSEFQLLFKSALQTTVYNPAINILFVLDNSSTMADTVSYNGVQTPKIDVLKSISTQLIALCDQQTNSNIRVRIVTFSSSATTLGTGWLTSSTAISLINGITTQTGSNLLNAIEVSKTAFLDNGKLAGKNVAYIISGITDDSVIDELNWKTFLNSNKIVAHSIMLQASLPTVTGKYLYGWGNNSNYELGLGTQTNILQITSISNNPVWLSISAGEHYTLGIQNDGTLWGWGNNNFGALGNNTSGNYSLSPVQVAGGGTNWKQVACGGGHTAAIKTDGTLWAWGYNNVGQLGNNSTASKSIPVQTVAGGTNWAQVSCGRMHTAAIKTDGTLWGWGNNAQGQLGDNTISHRSIPVQTVAGGNDWKQVSGIYTHTAAIKTDGTLWSWGYNGNGQLGLNDTADRYVPTKIGLTNDWSIISTGINFSAATKKDGTLWTWGNNEEGQLGLGHFNARNYPTQVGTDNNWANVKCGFYHVIGVKTDGTLWSWGNNGSGQLGDNSTQKRNSPIQFDNTRLWSYICVGANNSFALKNT